MVRSTRSIAGAAILLVNAVLAACGGDDGGDLGGGPDPAALSAARAEPSGNQQSGSVGQDLPNPLRIVIRRGATPTAGAVITWSAIGAGALMTPAVDTTGADGISSSVWHLGNAAGAQSSQAVVSGGADGSPVAFTAIASNPGAPAAVQIQLRNDGGNNRFEPANVSIPLGTTVTWTWAGGFHDVTPTGNPVFTPSGAPVTPPNTYSQTFNSPGTYLYFCSVHGSANSGMRGTIVVQ
jgi:plastocyanin